MEKTKLLVVAGPNGSGKTSVTDKILKHIWIEGCEYINPDNIARDVFGDWNARLDDQSIYL
jgi:predicted ABC-type ATPase